MNIKSPVVAICTLLLFCFLKVSHASTISLTPQNPTPQLGSSISIDIFMDFSDDSTLGGGVDILYNASDLSFISFTFDTTFLAVTDPLLTCPGAVGCSTIDLVNTVSNIAFGNFSGIGGPYLVGTLVFDTLAIGTTTLASAQTIGSAGPFVSASTFLPQPVTYLDTTITVTAVPLPGALLLMISGMGLLPLVVRRAHVD